MNKSRHDDEIVPYPKIRRVLEIMYPSVQRKPMIHGLLEVDVTEARQFLQEQKAKTGESLSFTAFIITYFAHAIGESKSLHVCRKGGKHLIIFDEVDVAIAIERDMSGQKQPIIYIIRAANTKSFREIHHEIRRPRLRGETNLGGKRSHELAALLAACLYSRWLAGLLLDASYVSARTKEVWWDSRRYSYWHVWQRRRLGYPCERSHP